MPIPVPQQRSGPATFEDGSATISEADDRRADDPEAYAWADASGPTKADQGAAAFFDLDNTLMRGASLFYLAKGLWSRKFFSHREVATALWQQTRFRVAGRENPGHLLRVRETALTFIAGWRVEELIELCEEIFDGVIATKIWPGTRALAQLHLDDGERVWLVTAAPVEIAQLIADRLGLTGALGTVAETSSGMYTGRLAGELLHGPAKAAAITTLAVTERLDLSACSAYSDSANDVPMLSMVGHPCAVNPDARLRIHAKMHGWRIRDFRRGRRAARAGLLVAGAAGATAGAAAAAVALHRWGRRWYKR